MVPSYVQISSRMIKTLTPFLYGPIYPYPYYSFKIITYYIRGRWSTSCKQLSFIFRWCNSLYHPWRSSPYSNLTVVRTIWESTFENPVYIRSDRVKCAAVFPVCWWLGAKSPITAFPTLLLTLFHPYRQSTSLYEPLPFVAVYEKVKCQPCVRSNITANQPAYPQTKTIKFHQNPFRYLIINKQQANGLLWWS